MVSNNHLWFAALGPAGFVCDRRNEIVVGTIRRVSCECKHRRTGRRDTVPPDAFASVLDRLSHRDEAGTPGVEGRELPFLQDDVLHGIPPPTIASSIHNNVTNCELSGERFSLSLAKDGLRQKDQLALIFKLHAGFWGWYDLMCSLIDGHNGAPIHCW
jgi:hypothetical protein